MGAVCPQGQTQAVSVLSEPELVEAVRETAEKEKDGGVAMGRSWGFVKVVMAKSPRRKWWYATKAVFANRELADEQVKMLKRDGRRAWVEGHTVYVR